MAKSKVKRYNQAGAVYEDDTPEEVANRSEESQAIANEAKGEGMLKAMRDEAAAVKPKAMAKVAPKNPNYSNEGRSTPAPAAKVAPKTPTVGRASVPMQESVTEKNRITNESLDKAREKWSKESASDRPSAFSRFLSDFSGSQRNRKYKSENMASGGMASSASKRADGIAQKGKTRGKMC